MTENGFGKRSSAYEYRTTGRGGSGIANIEITPRNGNAVASFPVAASDELMLMTDGGQLIRTHVRDVRIARRQTQGVTLLRVEEGDRVVSVTRIGDTETEDGGEANNEANGPTNGGSNRPTNGGSNGPINGPINGGGNGAAGGNGGGEGTA